MIVTELSPPPPPPVFPRGVTCTLSLPVGLSPTINVCLPCVIKSAPVAAALAFSNCFSISAAFAKPRARVNPYNTGRPKNLLACWYAVATASICCNRMDNNANFLFCGANCDIACPNPDNALIPSCLACLLVIAPCTLASLYSFCNRIISNNWFLSSSFWKVLLMNASNSAILLASVNKSDCPVALLKSAKVFT